MVLFWCIVGYILYKVCENVYDRFAFKDIPPGSVVLITGGCQGLGRELALVYASHKCKVVIWDITPSLFPSLKSEIISKGGVPFLYKCDIACEAEIKLASRLTLEEAGKVDIVVNNAALANHYLFDKLDSERLEKIFKVNVLGYAMVTKEFLDITKKIVVIASVISKFGGERAADYCATKHAVDGLFESLRLEVKRSKKPVKICMVYPFVMKTKMFDGYFAKKLKIMKSLEPRDVATAVYNAVCLGKEELYVPFYGWYMVVVLSMMPVYIKDRLLLWVCEGALDKVKPN